jgi:Ca2+/Na+ antiporter
MQVVDETRSNLGWHKEALLCQLILAPCVLVWSVLLHRFVGVSQANTYLAFAIALVLGAMAASLVHMTSRSSHPPAYIKFTALVGFLAGTAWIYIFAVELVHTLQAVGRVVGVSDAFLGLTVLGSSQSLGDLVTNIAVARGGMPRMAAAACIAAPLLDTLFGVGLAGILGNMMVASPFPMELNVQLYVTECFLIFALVSMLVLLLTNGMKAGKNFGVMLLIVYGEFVGIPGRAVVGALRVRGEGGGEGNRCMGRGGGEGNRCIISTRVT